VAQIEGDAAKACATGVGGANQGWELLRKFKQTRRPIEQVVAEPTKIVQGIVHAAIKTKAAFLGIRQSKLEMAEKAA
jgi:hypothetical protein